jgi:hypothetical protein
VASALRVPLDLKLEKLQDIPHTISYVIRKRIQVDNLNELPKEQRPPIKMMWEGTAEEIDEFLERAFNVSKTGKSEDLIMDLNDIEG